MKFDDITRFVEEGTYNINVPITQLKQTLDSYAKKFGLEMNPDFQRGHVWTRAQQSSYLEFFYRGGTSARTIFFNDPRFPSGHCKEGCTNKNMVLVDGLQRLTAHLDFLDNKVPIFGVFFKDFEDEPSIAEHSLIFNVNGLQKRSEVLQWYLEMNSGGTVHSEEELLRVQGLIDKVRLMEAEEEGA